jgi:hypothetical protein
MISIAAVERASSYCQISVGQVRWPHLRTSTEHIVHRNRNPNHQMCGVREQLRPKHVTHLHTPHPPPI